MTFAPLPLYHPRYWLIWLVMGVAWLIAQLPLSILWRIGRGLGRVLLRFAHRRRDYAQRNLALCFPEKSDSEREALLREHFAQLGMSLLEMLAVWFGRATDFTSRLDVTGLEHLQAAQATGKGVIICVFHTVHMEAMGLLAGSIAPIHPVYRPHENALLEWFMSRHRSRHTAGAISNRKIKEILNSLHHGQLVWLSPDQRNRGDGIVVPFFGHDTLTHPSIARIARLTDALVVPLFCHLTDSGRYQINIVPVLIDFPSNDNARALTQLMELLEIDIAQAPSQYLWVHNRFNL